jgi:hypothetical protein
MTAWKLSNIYLHMHGVEAIPDEAYTIIAI